MLLGESAFSEVCFDEDPDQSANGAIAIELLTQIAIAVDLQADPAITVQVKTQPEA